MLVFILAILTMILFMTYIIIHQITVERHINDVEKVIEFANVLQTTIKAYYEFFTSKVFLTDSIRTYQS